MITKRQWIYQILTLLAEANASKALESGGRDEAYYRGAGDAFRIAREKIEAMHIRVDDDY